MAATTRITGLPVKELELHSHPRGSYRFSITANGESWAYVTLVKNWSGDWNERVPKDILRFYSFKTHILNEFDTQAEFEMWLTANHY